MVLRCNTRHLECASASSPPGATLELSIEDNGCGFPAHARRGRGQGLPRTPRARLASVMTLTRNQAQ
jgi:hypothetical protein